jgi:SAM-dependent methyltransferase
MRTLRRALKQWIGQDGNPLLPVRSMRHLEAIRTFELDHVLNHLRAGREILEIGAGTGWQARRLSELGFKVHAIDVADSNYSAARVWPVDAYDGKLIPFPNASFDYVFSSNTLEHIPHVSEFQSEIHRVLRPQGRALHLVPSATWRVWTNLTNPLRYFSPPIRHGEHASNAFTEAFYFRRAWWARLFQVTGWTIEFAGGNGLFYTGCSVADARLSIHRRHALSAVFGSSCHVFVLKKANAAVASLSSSA